MTAAISKTARAMTALGILAAPFAVLALSGCPKKSGGASDAAPVESSTAAPTDTASAAAPSVDSGPVDSGKVIWRWDGAIPDANVLAFDAAMIPDVGIAFPDAMPSLPDAGSTPTSTDSGSTAAAPMPPECVQYIAQDEACIAKMPPAMQGGARTTLSLRRSGWTAMLANPATKDLVAGQCKAAAAALAANPICK